MFCKIAGETFTHNVPVPAGWKQRCGYSDTGIKTLADGHVGDCSLFHQSERRQYIFALGQNLYGNHAQRGEFVKTIREMEAHLRWTSLARKSHGVSYKIILYGSLASLVFNVRRLKVSTTLSYLAFLYLSLSSSCNILLCSCRASLPLRTCQRSSSSSLLRGTHLYLPNCWQGVILLGLVFVLGSSQTAITLLCLCPRELDSVNHRSFRPVQKPWTS